LGWRYIPVIETAMLRIVFDKVAGTSHTLNVVQNWAGIQMRILDHIENYCLGDVIN
jgi:hypothetical protein